MNVWPVISNMFATKSSVTNSTASATKGVGILNTEISNGSLQTMPIAAAIDDSVKRTIKLLAMSRSESAHLPCSDSALTRALFSPKPAIMLRFPTIDTRVKTP